MLVPSFNNPRSTMKLENIGLLVLCVAICISITSAKDAKKIIRGAYANYGERPYQAFLKNLRTGGLCGGIIIDATHILTAAHCVVSPLNKVERPQNMGVSTGFIDLVGADHYNVFGVAEITPHENYLRSNDIKLYADIAVLRLTRPIEFTAQQRPIRLATSAVPANTSVVVSGWGTTHFINGESVRHARWLQKLDLITISLDRCRQIHHNRVTNGQICAAGNGITGACFGDSGGPLTHNDELIGIVSWGEPCAVRGYPDVFTSVHHYLPWITETLKNH